MTREVITEAVRRIVFAGAPAGSGLPLEDALRTLDEAAAPATPLPEGLRHYLVQRSYHKAWLWLESHPEWRVA